MKKVGSIEMHTEDMEDRASTGHEDMIDAIIREATVYIEALPAKRTRRTQQGSLADIAVRFEGIRLLCAASPRIGQYSFMPLSEPSPTVAWRELLIKWFAANKRVLPAKKRAKFLEGLIEYLDGFDALDAGPPMGEWGEDE